MGRIAGTATPRTGRAANRPQRTRPERPDPDPMCWVLGLLPDATQGMLHQLIGELVIEWCVPHQQAIEDRPVDHIQSNVHAEGGSDLMLGDSPRDDLST